MKRLEKLAVFIFVFMLGFVVVYTFLDIVLK